MANVNLTVLANVLKEQWPDQVCQDATYRQSAILPYFKKILRRAGGKQQSFGLRTYPYASGGFAAEEAPLKTPLTEQFIKPYVTLQDVYEIRSLTQASIDDSKGNLDSLIHALTYVPESMVEHHGFRLARGMWSTGGSYPGALGLCGGNSSSTTLLLNSKFNFRKIHRQEEVDVKTTDGNDVTSGGSLGITAISTAAYTITVGTAVTTTATNYLAVEDEIYADSGWKTYVWNSIPSLIGTGNVCNITASSYPEYMSKVKTSVGTLTLPKMQEVVDYAEGHYAGTGNKTIVTSPEVLIKYADIFLSDVRYTMDDLKKMEAGYPTNVAYRGGTMGLIPIIKDNLCPLDEMYFINWDCLRAFYSAWMEWMDEDGSRFCRLATQRGYSLIYYSRANTAIVNRLGCGAWTGILI